MEGELHDLGGGRWQLRFTRRLAHPLDVVWGALTGPEQLRAWFPQTITGDLLTAGAALSFDTEHGSFPGHVLRVEPPTLLEFAWGTDTICLELAGDDRACTLTLSDTIDELGKAARDAAGWHTCLDLLEAGLTGSAPAFTSGERWASVHPRYVQRFGPPASTIGPPRPPTP
ncbi:MAG: SRPBCC domain-containing protein [Acidimicrobiales bacterium]|jgi:uncharacterized protein YndB with AHSA1/START domain